MKGGIFLWQKRKHASLSYIPVRRIAFSLVTVTVSSLLIDWVKEYTPKNGKTNV